MSPCVASLRSLHRPPHQEIGTCRLLQAPSFTKPHIAAHGPCCQLVLSFQLPIGHAGRLFENSPARKLPFPHKAARRWDEGLQGKHSQTAELKQTPALPKHPQNIRHKVPQFHTSRSFTASCHLDMFAKQFSSLLASWMFHQCYMVLQDVHA